LLFKVAEKQVQYNKKISLEYQQKMGAGDKSMKFAEATFNNTVRLGKD